jgi:hypothetical protein
VGSVDGEYLQALQGFLLVVSSDGDLVFLSENVNEHLGISQVKFQGVVHIFSTNSIA